MTKPKTRSRKFRRVSRKRSGFALIVTVSLLSLLVLVLVALASLTRIESSIGRNSLHFAQARQNALFAFDVAMGELQRHAGPDQRVTARSDLSSATIENRHWTGVWNSEGGFRTWLVSGNENLPNSGDPAVDVPLGGGNFAPGLAREQRPPGSGWEALSTAAETNFDYQFAGDTAAALLVGGITAGSNLGTSHQGFVLAPLIDLTSPAPGGGGNVTTGRYAWWVGDEGVKASVALEDFLEDIEYDPFDPDSEGANTRLRLRQQVPLTHQTFRGTGGSGGSVYGFDPAIVSNSEGIEDIVSRAQLRFLTSDSASATFTNFLRGRFHDLTTVSYGVLASTNGAFPGLKRDLSVAPELLNSGVAGGPFELWFASPDLELPDEFNTAAPPIVDFEDNRRRFAIVPPAVTSPASGEIVYSVAPVLSNFIIQFGFRRVSTNVEISTRVHVELWNPYTHSLVPEFLQVEITGLPTVDFSINGVGGVSSYSLQTLLDTAFGGSFVVGLPFAGSVVPASDQDSWLPGRVMNWRTGNLAGTASDPPDIPDLRFASKLFDLTRGWVATPAAPFSLPSDPGGLIVAGPAIDQSVSPIRLRLLNSGGQLIGEYSLPSTTAWITTPINEPLSAPATDERWRVGFGMRLPQLSESSANSQEDWLERPGGDPRRVLFDPDLLDYHHPNDDLGVPTDPVYAGVPRTEWNGGGLGFLLNRTSDPLAAGTFDNDTPIFEIPRMPVLSLGVLQHLQLEGARPFSIGNSWGSSIAVPGVVGGGSVGSWFDRFFFSGITADGPDLADDEPFPYFHYRVFDPDSSLDNSTFETASEATTSRHLLIAGAFNVNSTSVDAWEAVLRSLRPGVPDGWYVSLLGDDTGTVNDPDDNFPPDTTDSTQATGGFSAQGSGFFRFSQSAQETFHTDGDSGGMNRAHHRQGFRGGNSRVGQLSSTQIRSIATEVVALLRAKGEPFTSMEEFVSPTGGPGTRSLLEQAIFNAGVNTETGANVDFDGDGSLDTTGEIPMCSLKLTQADVLTALAPMLQNRSDTFVVRTYGEAVNPVTGVVDGRAWCEATVQRIPTPVDSADIIQPSLPFGRRFQIVSFRWLTPEDI